jgi:hypothetical protein
MKLTKTLGLAVVAIAVLTTFAGSASAARPHPLIAFCKAQELLLCAAANQIKSEGTLLFLQIGTGRIEGAINYNCIGGEIQAEAGEMVDGAEPSTESKLLGKITKLAFTGCEPCKKNTTTPPFTANTKMKEEAENGKWILEGALNFRLEECSFGFNCKFGATELKPEPFIEMTATEAILNTNKAELKREEGSEFFCGNTGKWNAKYKLELKLPDGTVHNIWPTLAAAVVPRLHPLIKF